MHTETHGWDGVVLKPCATKQRYLIQTHGDGAGGFSLSVSSHRRGPQIPRVPLTPTSRGYTTASTDHFSTSSTKHNVRDSVKKTIINWLTLLNLGSSQNFVWFSVESLDTRTISCATAAHFKIHCAHWSTAKPKQASECAWICMYATTQAAEWFKRRSRRHPSYCHRWWNAPWLLNIDIWWKRVEN